MNKIYLSICTLLCWGLSSQAQLTVSAFANTPTICSGSPTTITASATPVGYAISTIPNSLSPNLSMNVLAEAGVAITPYTSGTNLDDCRWDNISLPFGFRFFGNLYNSVCISSNGWVSMGSTASTVTGMGFTLPNATAPNNVIHGVTADLDLRGASGGSLEYFEDGVTPNRTFTISYTDVLFRTGGGSVSFQIVLHETSNVIDIHTDPFTNTTLGKAQGVENAAGTVANTVTGRNNTTNWTGTGFTNGYRFTPDVITFSWSPASGLNTTTGAVVTASPMATTTYTINATNVTSGATGSTSTTITVDPASFTLAGTPVAGGSPVCLNNSVSTSGTDYRNNNCNLIARILPSGGNPVTNVINTCVRVDTGATKKGTADLYAARNYDIEPQINPATATATVTLYFLQAEMNKFNLRAPDSGHTLLPSGPGDATGIANLIIRQFHGTGTRPGLYSAGTFADFTTATAGVTVSWNATRSWWEVTLPVAGFSGFYLTSKRSAPIPVILEYFKGSKLGSTHVLNWKVNCTSTEVKFELERSADGRQFVSIGGFRATQVQCLQPFNYTDRQPAAGLNYYRLKMIDVDGKAGYSNIVALLNKESGFDVINITPSVVTGDKTTLNITAAANTAVEIMVTDIAGKVLQNQKANLVVGTNAISLETARLASGTYQVTVFTGAGRSETLRFVKQ